MQDMDSDICLATKENETKQLRDSRDGRYYWVAKLKDGRCWMTQNLDLDLKKDEPLTGDSSDIHDSWTPNDTQMSASPSFSSAYSNLIASWDPAMGGTPTYCNDAGVAGKCKTSGNSTTSINDGHDAQGNYYSWGAATAGQAAGFDSNTTYPVRATQSICPRGWRLPTGGSDGEFHDLMNDMTGNIITISPYYFIYGGQVYENRLANAGGSGYYWSSIAYSVVGARYLSFSTNSVNPSDGQQRFRGNFVRCVAR